MGRVISVRGSLQARIGPMAGAMSDVTINATVGQFFGIRTAKSTLVFMITEVSCETFAAAGNYTAVAAVDLLGEIGGGPAGAASSAASPAIRPSYVIRSIS